MTETILPVTSGILSCEKPMHVLRAAGVVFHEPVGESGVLFRATLPFGWCKSRIREAVFKIRDPDGKDRETSFTNYKLLDERGRERATTFEPELVIRSYITLSRRFRFALDYEREKLGEIVSRVHGENGVVLHHTQVFQINPNDTYEAKIEKERLAQEEAEQWLDTYYPNWREPGAYWD